MSGSCEGDLTTLISDRHQTDRSAIADRHQTDISEITEKESAAHITSLETDEEDTTVMRSTDKEAGTPLLQAEPGSDTIPLAYDTVLLKLGFTCRLVIIIACSGIGLLSDTLEIMSISFAKDDISKELKLSRQEESTLAGVLFAGMLIGGLFWGRAADIYGRRKVLMISLSMNGVCAAISSLTLTFPTFLTARFFSGIGVGGSLPIIFSYISEWVYSRVRGRVISAVATCWMVGSVLAAAWAWAILPNKHSQHDQYWQPWRSYLLVCSIPSLVAAILYGLLNESPLFLIQTGKKKEALTLLKNYANNVDISEELGALKRCIEDEVRYSPLQQQTCSPTRIIKEFVEGICALFSSRLIKITCLLMAVILPVHFGYYGFMLWFPEYISHQSGGSGTVKTPEYVYIESFYVALASLPGNLFTVLLADKLGPKPILCGCLLLSAGSVFLLWEFNTVDMTVMLSCLFNAVTTPVFNMMDIIIPALYPTHCRTTAFGFHSSLIRIAMITSTWMFSLFIDSSPTLPILLTAVFLLTSAVISLLLPNIAAVSH